MNLQLSKRLRFIAELVNPDRPFADIGSDHAYLPSYICLQEPTASAIAGEVRQGPYESALATVNRFGLSDQIDVRLGDGLSVLQGEDQVSDLVIAGMGGSLISQILLDGKLDELQIDRFILQPNNNEIKVRETVRQLGYRLEAEYIIQEKGLWYEVLLASHHRLSTIADPYDAAILEKQLLFGPYFLEERPALFIEKWRQEAEKLTKTIEEMMKSNAPNLQDKIKAFKTQLQWIEEVIS